MGHRLSVGRILKRDWPSLSLSVFISAFWLMAVATYLAEAVWPASEPGGWRYAHIATVGALLLTAVCGPVVVWRVWVIRRVFAHGEAVRGQVLVVGENADDIGYAVIVYQYQGQEYRVTKVTERLDGREVIAAGDPVDIVVDPGKPSRAFLAKPFLRER